MRRRTLILLGLGILFALLLVGFLAQWDRRVQIGMTKSEVEEMLGDRGVRLQFQASEELRRFAEDALMMPAPTPGATMMRWDGKHSSVHVLFDNTDTVIGVYYPRVSGGRIVNIVLRSVGLD